MKATLFYVISYSDDYGAHIVEAENMAMAFNAPLKTYRVYRHELKYRYCDLDSEARKEAERIKSRVDPRIICNPAVTLEEILLLPQMKGRETDIEFLKATRTLLMEAPDDIKKKQYRRYELAHSNPGELYAEIKAELKTKMERAVMEIKPFTQTEYRLGLQQAGYSLGLKKFAGLEEALLDLHNAWETNVKDYFSTTARQSPYTSHKNK